MKFGGIETYLLLGGGQLLFESATLLKAKNRAVLVVTSPRHAAETVPGTNLALEQSLADHGVACLVSQDVNTDERVAGRIDSRTLGLSFGAAWIIREEFIDRFAGRLLNLHGARLPLDRGAGGFSWQILRGNRLGNCLIHQVDTGVDTGPVVVFEEFLFPPWCRIPADYQRVYTEKNRTFLERFFEAVEQETDFTVVPQTEYLSTYWPRLSTEHQGYIDWSWDAAQIDRFICAFDSPYRGASTFINGRRVFVKSSFVDGNCGEFHPFQAGMIYRKSSEALFVAARGGSLVIGSVCSEDAADIRASLRLGDRFHTPGVHLESARLFRPTYTPFGLKA